MKTHSNMQERIHPVGSARLYTRRVLCGLGLFLLLSATACSSKPKKWTLQTETHLPKSITSALQVAIGSDDNVHVLAQDGTLWLSRGDKTLHRPVELAGAPAKVSFIAPGEGTELLVIASGSDKRPRVGRLPAGATQLQLVELAREPTRVAVAEDVLFYLDTANTLRSTAGGREQELDPKEVTALVTSPDGDFIAIEDGATGLIRISKTKLINWLTVPQSKGTELLAATNAGEVMLLRRGEISEDGTQEGSDLDLRDATGKNTGLTGDPMVTAHFLEDAIGILREGELTLSLERWKP